MTEVPDRLFVVAPNKTPLAPGSHGLAHLAFWRREGAFAWIRARGFEEHWSVAEVPIYPAFPSGPWHAQVPVEAAVVPTATEQRGVYTPYGCLPIAEPPRTVSDDGYEPALAVRAREGGNE